MKINLTIEQRIFSAIADNEAHGAKAVCTALKQIKWRLKYGLLYAGLDGVRCVLVADDDPRCQVFDGRDNEQMKARFYGALLNCKFEVEVI